MRFGSRVGMSPSYFNMRRTDVAGALMLVAVLVFLVMLFKTLSD